MSGGTPVSAPPGPGGLNPPNPLLRTARDARTTAPEDYRSGGLPLRRTTAPEDYRSGGLPLRRTTAPEDYRSGPHGTILRERLAPPTQGFCLSFIWHKGHVLSPSCIRA
jgi:hypothetical protein